jgi:hypothetical protein
MGRRQQGLGLVPLILVLAIAGTVIVIGLKLVPVYLEYYSIKRALVHTVQEDARNATVADLRKAFQRRAEVDDIKSVTAAEVDITKDGGTPVMSVSYAAKVHLFYNASICLDFDASSN